MRLISTIVLLAVALHWNASAQRQIYVSPEGRDQATGSFEDPFGSLRAAMTQAEPGTEVLVSGGVYRDRETFRCVGTSDQPITIRALGGDRPVFDGAGLKIPRYQALFTIANARHCIVSGLEIRNSNEDGMVFNESVDLVISGNLVHHVGGRGIAGSGRGIKILENEVYETVRINRRGDPDYTSPTELGGWGAAVATHMWASTKEPSSDIEIADNLVYKNWGEGIIALRARDVVIRGNTIHDNWSMNVYVDKAEDVLIEDNYIHTTTDERNRSGAPAHGIGFSNEDYWPAIPTVARVLVQNNLLVDQGKGIVYWSMEGNTSDENSYREIRIQHNVIYEPRTAGVEFRTVGGRQVSGSELTNNVIYGTVSIADAEAWTVGGNNFVQGVPDRFAGSGNMARDPGFVGGTSARSPEDFRLKANSPLIDSGQSNSSRVDYFGTLRGKDSPDIGIHEFQENGLSVQILESLRLGTDIAPNALQYLIDLISTNTSESALVNNPDQ